MTLKALTEKYGVSHTTIRERMREAGVQIRKVGRPLGSIKASEYQDRNIKIAEMYQQGGNYREIGERFGMCGERVRQIVVACGVEPRKRGLHLNESELEDLKAMLGEGLTYKEIASHFGVRSENISNLIKREGLTKTYVPRVSWDYKKAEIDYLSGVPLVEIARRQGLSSYTIIIV